MKNSTLYLFLAVIVSGCQHMSANTSMSPLDSSAHQLGLAAPSDNNDLQPLSNKPSDMTSRVQTTLASPYKTPAVKKQFASLRQPDAPINKPQSVAQATNNIVKITGKLNPTNAKPQKGRTKTLTTYKKIASNDAPKDTWERLRSGFSLPDLHEQNPLQAHFERHFAKEKRYFHQISQRGYWYLPYILQEVEKRGMPTEIALIPAIESKYTPQAISKSKAKGIWQFMAPTARHFGLALNDNIDARADLIESTRAALDYLEYLHDFFDGDWILAMAAYNAGEGTIQRALRRNKRLGKPLHYSALDLKQEPTEYVPRILAVRNIIKSPEKYNVELLDIPNEPTLSIVDSDSQIDLEVAASLIPLSTQELRDFNVAYKNGITPAEGPHRIAVPSRYEGQLRRGLDKLPIAQYMRWQQYQVRPGDVLSSIAKNHGTNVRTIKQVNNLNSNTIRIGQKLKLPLIGGLNTQIASNKKSSSKKDFHIVRSGDSLWEIARKNGLSVTYIQSLNNLTRNTVLRLGQRLRLTE